MQLIYEYDVNKVFANGDVARVSYDGAFAIVYMENGAPKFFIMTNYSIGDLKNIELKEFEDYGKIIFNVGYESLSDLEPADYFDIFDENNEKIGFELSYKVSLPNLRAFKKAMSDNRVNGADVYAYKCRDTQSLEKHFYRWFYESFKDDLKDMAKSSDVFNKPENYKDLMRSTVKIASDNVLTSNTLTFWDSVDLEKLVANPEDMEKRCQEFLEFTEEKASIPVLF